MNAKRTSEPNPFRKMRCFFAFCSENWLCLVKTALQDLDPNRSLAPNGLPPDTGPFRG